MAPVKPKQAPVIPALATGPKIIKEIKKSDLAKPKVVEQSPAKKEEVKQQQ